MEIYLVGGAIRDKLMGLSTFDRDWVVVGSTPEELCSQGFKPVGKDFPVFLHPTTHEEYALARTERKTAQGYRGFAFHYAPDVTLEEDLQRRDLTINAIAESQDGQLIDPYNGQHDIRNKIFRHVSTAFAEDPVRILRVARFASRFPEFNVHPNTNTLMKTMVDNGEVDALVTERIWQELSRALSYSHPSRFFTVLTACGANKKLWPELGSEQINALTTVCKTLTEPHLRFAAVVQSMTPVDAKSFIKRLRPPKTFTQIAECTNKNYPIYTQLNLNCATQIHNLFKKTDALRQPERFTEFCRVCNSLCNTLGKEKTHFLQNTLTAVLAINTQPLQQRNLIGVEFAKALYILQIETIKTYIKQRT